MPRTRPFAKLDTSGEGGTIMVFGALTPRRPEPLVSSGGGAMMEFFGSLSWREFASAMSGGGDTAEAMAGFGVRLANDVIEGGAGGSSIFRALVSCRETDFPSCARRASAD